MTAARAIPPDALLHAVSPADWFLTAALRHPSFAFLRSDPETTLSLASEQEWTVRVLDPSELTDDQAVTVTENATADKQLINTLKERLCYC